MKFETETVSACGVCGGAFSGRAVEGNWINVKDENGQPTRQPLCYYQCATCGAWTESPRLTDAYTATYYSGTYRETSRPISFKTCYHGRMRAAEQVKRTGHLLRGVSALDVGCSRGYLLGELAGLGFTERAGVDPDPDSVAQFRRLEDVTGGPFDLVACSHALEHFNHPRAVLAAIIQNFTHRGTRLLVDVPNYGTCHEGGLFQIHHPYMFDLSSLSRLLVSVGVRVIFNCLHGDGLDNQDNLLVVGEVL